MGKSKDLANLGGGALNKSLTITGSANDANIFTAGFNQTNLSILADATDGELRISTEDASGNNYTKYMTFYTEGGSGPIERMKIDASGRVTMPYQPSYMASEGQSVVSSGTVVKYSNIAFNVGNHYNSTNGRFTAPVTGIYVVGCYIQAHTTTHQTYTSITFQKNGSQYGESELVQTWAGGSDHTVTGGVTLMQMNAGDYAQVYAGRGYRGIQGHSFAYLVG